MTSKYTIKVIRNITTPNFLACLTSQDPQIHQIFGEFGGLARPVKFCPLALCKPDYLAEGAIFFIIFYTYSMISILKSKVLGSFIWPYCFVRIWCVRLLDTSFRLQLQRSLLAPLPSCRFSFVSILTLSHLWLHGSSSFYDSYCKSCLQNCPASYLFFVIVSQ